MRMAAEEMAVFWVGTALFGIATLVFALLGRLGRSNKIFANSNFLVSFITTVSYTVMAMGIAITVAPNGQPIYWTRWLFYIASCGILTYEISVIVRKPSEEVFEVPFLTGMTMFCGFLASFLVGVERWWFFVFSSAAYVSLLYVLFCSRSRSAADSGRIMWFVSVTWSLFPLVWVLAPTGFNVFTTFVESILYLALDILTKIAFGLYAILRQTEENVTG